MKQAKKIRFGIIKNHKKQFRWVLTLGKKRVRWMQGSEHKRRGMAVAELTAFQDVVGIEPTFKQEE